MWLLAKSKHCGWSVNKVIEALIPHKGTMCLLDDVLTVDAADITCQTKSHLSPNNPLLVDGSLSPVVVIEYAAQAAALHQPWLAKAAGRQESASGGYLAAVRNVKYGSFVDLAKLQTDLIVKAEKLMQSPDGLIYSFEVSANKELVANGRFVIATGVADVG